MDCPQRHCTQIYVLWQVRTGGGAIAVETFDVRATGATVVMSSPLSGATPLPSSSW